jgi:photosystem II stability/assembly factor-like uncharacterized protein
MKTGRAGCKANLATRAPEFGTTEQKAVTPSRNVAMTSLLPASESTEVSEVVRGDRRTTLMVVAVVAGLGLAGCAPGTQGVGGRPDVTTTTGRTSTTASAARCPTEVRLDEVTAATFLTEERGLAVWSLGGRCGAHLVTTTDGGSAWKVVGTKLPAPVSNVGATMVFASARVGWVNGGGALVMTTDGGLSWKRVELRGTVVEISRSASSLWAFVSPCGPLGRACRYRLEEASLSSGVFHAVGELPATFANYLPLLAVRLTNRLAVVAVGQMGAPEPALTTDGGRHWTSVRTCRPQGFVPVSFAASSVGHVLVLCLGGGAAGSSLHSLLASRDGGRTWSLVAADTNLASADRPVPTDDGGVLAVSSGGRLLMATVDGLYDSTSGGVRWKSVAGLSFDGRGAFASFSFVNPRVGWMLVPQLGLWRTADGGRSWTALR